jgi:membrane associated rhomboid family serine protease
VLVFILTYEQISSSPTNSEYTATARVVDPDHFAQTKKKNILECQRYNEKDIQRLRLLASKLSADWRHVDILAPALARRVRDFQFAQEKRRKKYGDERPWGILGVYDHLASIRVDVEWAEDAARRRANGDAYQSWADFDEGKKGGRNRPYFTYVLLFLCTAILIATIAVNEWSIEPLDVNPMIGPSAETLILMGAKESHLIVNEKQGWRLLSSAFLHVSVHIALFNFAK